MLIPDDKVQASPALRPRLEFAAKAFIVASFVGALAAGTLRLSQKAFAAREFRVDLSRWTVLARPPWSTLDDVRRVREASGLERYYASVFDTAALAGVEDRLACAPTVRRVAGVRRVYPNRLEAVIELRRPAAVVRVAGKKELWVETDEEGVALSAPLAERPVRGGFRLRGIVGAMGSVPAPGGRFGDDVVAAASIAESLDFYTNESGRALLAQVDKIDVSNYGGRVKLGTSEINLGALPQPAAPAGSPPPLSGKCVVEWGRAGGRDGGGSEMPFDAKASHLLEALRLFPRLEGLKTVRVAFHELSVVADGAKAPAHLKQALEIDGGVQAK